MIVLVQRRHREADVGVAAGELLLQPPRDGRHIRRRAFGRHTRFQPPDRPDVPRAAVGCAEHLVVLERHPHLHAGRIGKPGGMTPTTTCGLPSMRRTRPMIAGSPPNRCCQSR